MEAEVNEFTKRSKKYRTRYLDEIGKLYRASETNNNRENLIIDERSENFDSSIAG